MLNPKCSRCGGLIPTDDLNVAKDLAFCRKCNLVGTLSELVGDVALDPDVDLARPPKGCWHRPDGIGTRLGASHRSPGSALGLLAVCLFWNGIVSVFVLLAVASTLHLLKIPVPDWFPAPKMNGETMGVGMTIFLWIFLSPFIAIGLALLGGFLSSLAGRTEVIINRGEVGVFTGIGPVGWTRRFMATDLKGIRIDDRMWRDSDGDNRRKTHIVAELQDGRLIKFGSMLREDRRRFLAAAANKVIRG